MSASDDTASQSPEQSVGGRAVPPPAGPPPYPPHPQGSSAPAGQSPQPYPGQPYPGQPYPGQQYPQQPQAGQPYPGQQYPGQPYPQQLYPGPHGPAGYPARPSTGTVSWAMGFLQFVPAVGLVVAGIVMAVMYPSVARQGGVARENARGAANWGLTVLLAIVVGVLLAIVLNGVSHNRGFFPTGIGLLLIVAVAVVHLVTTIVGTVRASGGRAFAPPYAIPFLRR